MMYEILYRFLIKYRRIDLPGIGAIAFRVHPAESQFVNHSFVPPRYYAVLEQGREESSRQLLSWLSMNYNISEEQATSQFNDFIGEITRLLSQGKSVVWNGVGVLEKGPADDMKLVAARHDLEWLWKTPGKKVIRENAEHVMLVGETEKTSVQMTELLANPKSTVARRHNWWVWPLAVIIAIFIFLGWYFSEHGLSGPATGNNHKATSTQTQGSRK